ncbi:unnamed protein product [Schistosoma turkestanicum]|nr:unnamed protein product [Schistosoma turkestanicum]CAH8538791.1 unnamed protein product [Schistosoma turkestanicum]
MNGHEQYINTSDYVINPNPCINQHDTYAHQRYAYSYHQSTQPYQDYTIENTEEHVFPLNETHSIISDQIHGLHQHHNHHHNQHHPHPHQHHDTTSYLDEINTGEASSNQNVMAPSAVTVTTPPTTTTTLSTTPFNDQQHHSHYYYQYYYLQGQPYHSSQETLDLLTLQQNCINYDLNASCLMLQHQQHQQQELEQQRQVHVTDDVTNIMEASTVMTTSMSNITTTSTTTNSNNLLDKVISHMNIGNSVGDNRHHHHHHHNNCMKSQPKLSTSTNNNNNNTKDDEGYEDVVGEGDGKRQHQILLKSDMLCLICEDKATGKHYGAYSCDGCKGFFRRSVRRKHSYTCRHKKNCSVTKDKRNQCRFCRFRKCFRVGMKESAVQKERDKISNRHTTYDLNSSIHSIIDLQKLLQAEAIANCVRAIHQNYMNSTAQKSSNSLTEQFNYQLNENNLANIHDICESIHNQLIFLIEWAKNLTVFTSLTINDQIALLQAHAGEMLILGAVWRSITLGPTIHKSHDDSEDMEKLKQFEQKTTHPAHDNTLLCDTSEHNTSNTTTVSTITTSTSADLNVLVTAVTTTNATLTLTTTDPSPSSPAYPPSSKTSTTTTTNNNISNINDTERSFQTNLCINDTVTNDDNTYIQTLNDEPKFILLGNNRIISRQNPQPEIANLANQIMNEIYQPIQNLCLDDIEIVCFRAIMFFDPSCESLSENGRLLIRSCQYLIQSELMNIMNSKLYLPQGRFGALLLLIPEFRSITYQMIHNLQIAQQMGCTKFDGLLSEILLNDSINQSNHKIEPIQLKSTVKYQKSLNKSIFTDAGITTSTNNDSIVPDSHPIQHDYTLASTTVASSSSSSSSCLLMSTSSNIHFNDFLSTSNEIDYTTPNQSNHAHYEQSSSRSNKMYSTTANNTTSPTSTTTATTTTLQSVSHVHSPRHAISHDVESIPSVQTCNAVNYYEGNHNNNNNETYTFNNQSDIDTLALYYHTIQPIMSTVGKLNTNTDNNTNNSNNNNDRNHSGLHYNDINQSIFTMHLAQENFENISNSDCTVGCPPTLEPGVYYTDNQLYTTYSYNLNMNKSKYNQNIYITTTTTTANTTSTHISSISSSDNNYYECNSPVYTNHHTKTYDTN